MENPITTKQVRVFYKLSKWMLIYYIIIFILSILVAVLNYFASAVGTNTEPYRIASIIFSSASSVLIIIFWFVGRSQQDRLDYIMSKTKAWFCNVCVDLLEIAYIVLNTITALYNGRVFKDEFMSGMPITTLLLIIVATINFCFALAYLLLSKKKFKTKLDF